MKIIVLTRFSIYNDPDNFYLKKNDLYNEDRLQTKFRVFEHKTIPSILSQSFKDWEWHIFTSYLLPYPYMIRLKSMIEKHNNIHLQIVHDHLDFIQLSNSIISLYPDFMTMRIDDDDSLDSSVFSKLQQYQKDFNTIISLVHGRLYTWNILNSCFEYGKTIKRPLVSVGLTAIKMNIFNCGPHHQLFNKFPIKYIDDPDLYFLYSDENYTWSKRKFLIDNNSS